MKKRSLLILMAAIATATVLAPLPALAGAGTDTLWGNETLYRDQSLFSPSRAYEARMQSDGNFVVYGPNGPLWSSNSRGSVNSRLVMQSDGNVVLYDGAAVPFATNTFTSGARLVMQNDGNLVLYGSSGAVWASQNTAERAIQWFYNRLGSTGFEGQCEKAVENSFNTNGVYLTARANWNARAQRTPYGAAPRGALVFYSTSASGHVAISLGNGQVISTSAGGRIGTVAISYFQSPLGWAWAPW